MRDYAVGWLIVCVVALVFGLYEKKRFTLFDRRYWRGLARPWKLVTFAVALTGMAGLASRTGDPTWDAYDGAFMSVLAFTTAPWTLGVIARALRGQARSRAEVYLAVVTWLFSASWSYDGYLLLRDGSYPATWAANLLASSGLYAAAGAMWSLAWRPGRGLTFAFLEPDWPASLADGSFRRVAPLAAVFMGAVMAMLGPFLWAALSG